MSALPRIPLGAGIALILIVVAAALLANVAFLGGGQSAFPWIVVLVIAVTAGVAYLRVCLARSGQAAADLRRLNADLEQRLAQQTAELGDMTQELAAATEELEAFAYSVSHDLRSPLRSIDGFSLAVLEDAGDKLDAQSRDHLDRVRAGCQRMGQLIDDILALSRVTRTPLVRERVDLSRLAAKIANSLAAQEPQRAAGVSFVIAPDLSAHADERLMTIVLEHLLGNAWKFTSRHPTARIEFGAAAPDRPKPGRCPGSSQIAEFFVRDDGVGFDPAYAAKLFAPFQRLHGASEYPGSGIGLTTVQRIIRRHGGTIRARGAVDKGATMCFTLQASVADNPREGAEPS